MTDDKKPELDDEATVPPDTLRYPAMPLAYQTTSPFIPAGPVEEAPAAEVRPPRPTSDEPWGLLDVVEPPATYGVDELALLARDPWTLFVWWEATEAGLLAARAEIGEPGRLVLRLYVASVGGAPRSYDVLLDTDHGQRYLGTPRHGAHVLPALGLRGDSGRFAVIARAPRVLVPFAEPQEGPVEWMEVAPARTRGERLEPPSIVHQGPADEIAGAGRVILRSETAARAWPRRPSPLSPTSPIRGGRP
jgi:hypothetical protein